MSSMLEEAIVDAAALKEAAIKNAENKMPNYIGKPIYKGYQESIETWKNEIKEHKKMIDIYYLKFKSL